MPYKGRNPRSTKKKQMKRKQGQGNDRRGVETAREKPIAEERDPCLEPEKKRRGGGNVFNNKS